MPRHLDWPGVQGFGRVDVVLIRARADPQVELVMRLLTIRNKCRTAIQGDQVLSAERRLIDLMLIRELPGAGAPEDEGKWGQPGDGEHQQRRRSPPAWHLIEALGEEPRHVPGGD